MKRMICMMFALWLCIMAFCGCSREAAKETHPCEAYLPKIDSFSGTVLNEGDHPFSKIKSATLIQDGKETPVSSEDTRLIRLLNAICYSTNNRYTTMLQGNLSVDKMAKIDAENAPYIDVYFQDVTTDHYAYYCGIEHIRIYPTTVLTFRECFWEEEEFDDYRYQGQFLVTPHYPFSILVEEQNQDYSPYDVGVGNTTDLDLLTYAGFR